MNEFDIIKKYLKPLTKMNSSSLYLEDDIYFDKKKGVVISVDTYVQGVHFFATNPKKFLKKVLRSSLSDIYCKGIKPKHYFLSFSLKKGMASNAWMKSVKKILASEQKMFNIALSGGDTTFSSNFVTTVVVLGETKSNPVLRKGCNFNDDIYVTGNIGDSYIGLSILQKKKNFGKYNNFFVKKFYEPDLPYKFSPHLSLVATASIDVSDGLGQDLKHLCAASKFGAEIDLNLIPLSNKCNYLVNTDRLKLKKIFSNGDDYQILFTANRKNRSKINSLAKKTETKISRIGVVVKEKNIVFKYNSRKIDFSDKNMGYIHNFN
jgi:thiamine-monophosphate kinase